MSISEVLQTRSRVTSSLLIVQTVVAEHVCRVAELSGSLNGVRSVRLVIVDHLQAKYASDHYLSQGKEMLCRQASCHVAPWVVASYKEGSSSARSLVGFMRPGG